MHKVAANYTLPTVLNTLKSNSTTGLANRLNPKAAGSTSTNNTNSSSNPAQDLGSTFLNLLSEELQNQDPTAPVDPTQMVGQMISLNQLDQLISINQVLTSGTSGSSGSGSGSVAPAGPVAKGSSLAPAVGNTSPTPASSPVNQLPFDPNTLMPVISGNSGAIGASLNSFFNPTTLGMSATNNTSGGK